ncbi:MAG: hypothetical protein R3E66_13100 [bacterium]
MAKRAPVRYWFVVGLTQGLGALVALGGAIYFWSTSFLALAVFLGLMVLPIVFYASVGSVGFDPTKSRDAIVAADAPTIGRRVWIATSPVLLFGVLFTLLIGSFQLGAVRKSLVIYASEHGYAEVAEKGLFDPDQTVRISACETIAEHSADSSSLALSRAIQYDDALADCAMQAINSGAPDIMMEFHASRWEEELLAGTQQAPPERMCSLAKRLYHADRIGVPSAMPRLMTCATEADASAARECCAQSLIAAKGEAPSLVSLLPTPEAFSTSSFVDRLPAYLRATRREPTNSVEAALAMNSAPMQSWSIRAGCTTLSTQDFMRDELTAALRDASQTAACDPPAVTPGSMRMWETACQAVTPLTPEADVPETLCRAAKHTIVNDSNLAANLAIKRAIAAARQPQRDAELTKAIFDYVGSSAKTIPNAQKLIVPTNTGIDNLRTHLNQVSPEDPDSMANFIRFLTNSQSEAFKGLTTP